MALQTVGGGRLARLVLLVAILLAVFALALSIGTTSLDPAAALRPELRALRLPRILLAALAGAGLAVSGVAFQAILRNPLADPFVAGVSGGAALGGVIALVLGVTAGLALPACAFAGAALSALLLFGLARARGRSDALTLLLIGVIFNAFAAAVVTFLKTVVSAAKQQEILFWLMGVIDPLAVGELMVLAVYLTVGCTILLVGAGALNLLSTGDDEAAALGLPVERVRLILFLAASLIVGAVVASTGMIGFVGLVVPHVLRRLMGADHRRLLPAAILGGAAFLTAADALARIIYYFYGNEVPVGVVTAFTGGPFFLLLLLRRHD